MIRVAIVASHPIQHFGPLYREIARRAEVTLKVFFASASGAKPYFDLDYNTTVEWQGDLLSGYDYEFLPGATETDVQASVDNRFLNRYLNDFSPDVVQVYGFYHRISRRAITWAQTHRRGVVMMADSELLSPRSRLTMVRKRITVPLMLRRVDAILTIGDCNETYYRFYGASEEKFFRSPYPIDTTYLDRVIAQASEIRRRVREELKINSDERVALVVGKLTERKAPLDAVDAILRVRDTASVKPRLLFAGDGPMRPAIERIVESRSDRAVTLLGFRSVAELAELYVAADILIHPSSEDPHPLATSEAAYVGIPVIASSRVGSVGPTDDLRPGMNVVVYPYGDRDQLAAAIVNVLEPHTLERMKSYADVVRKDRTLSRSVDGFAAAAKYAASKWGLPL